MALCGNASRKCHQWRASTSLSPGGFQSPTPHGQPRSGKIAEHRDVAHRDAVEEVRMAEESVERAETTVSVSDEGYPAHVVRREDAREDDVEKVGLVVALGARTRSQVGR